MGETAQRIPLGRALCRATEERPIVSGETYKQVTARLHGKGLVLRDEVDGSEIAASTRVVVREGQFLLSKIDARHGAFGLVPAELDGAVVTGDFPAFAVDDSLLDRHYLGWMSKTESFVDMCRRASKGSTNRVRLQEGAFLAEELLLPNLDEQRRVVARIEDVAGRVEAVRALRAANEADASALLLRLFRDATKGALRTPMGKAAPLVRRPVEVDERTEYQELGVRSFGKGTFEKTPMTGADLGGKRVFWIARDDVIFSNVFAWEGAVAVATPDDDGRIGSHRFMTCVCDPEVVLPAFLRFYFTTPEGLSQLVGASPGGAGRNRTLGVEALARLPVLAPPVANQQTFLRAVDQVTSARQIAESADADLSALLASTLDAAFAGRL